MDYEEQFPFDEKKVLSPGSNGLRPITDGMLQVFSFDNIIGGATRTESDLVAGSLVHPADFTLAMHHS